MAEQTIRFASGPKACPSSSNWRLWVNGDDTYLASRQTARTLKLSLHASGTWISAFTSESKVQITDSISGRVSRRHTTWSRPAELAPGWTQGPSLVVPGVSWRGELTGTVDYHPKTSWFPAPPEGGQICFTVFFSAADKT